MRQLQRRLRREWEEQQRLREGGGAAAPLLLQTAEVGIIACAAGCVRVCVYVDAATNLARPLSISHTHPYTYTHSLQSRPKSVGSSTTPPPPRPCAIDRSRPLTSPS